MAIIMVILRGLFYVELPVSSPESDPRRKLIGIRNPTNIKGGRWRQQMPADEAGTGERGGRSLFTAHATGTAGRQLDLTTQALPQQQQLQQQEALKEFRGLSLAFLPFFPGARPSSRTDSRPCGFPPNDP